MARRRAETLFLTCEHGGNRVPARYRALFTRAAGALNSHRGWDPGALQLARQMAAALDAPLLCSTVSRLLVDLNRSETHPRVLSKYSRSLSAAAREALFDRHYGPFRSAALQAVKAEILAGYRVIHISVHSFTPVLRGVRRSADIGLLYDPRRPRERALANAWRKAIRNLSPGLRVRMNYPYLGTSDGHTTSLRGRFQPDFYAGIELEVNQAIVRAGGRRWAGVRAVLVGSLAAALSRDEEPPAGAVVGSRDSRMGVAPAGNCRFPQRGS